MSLPEIEKDWRFAKMDVVAAKVVSIVTLFFLTLIFAVLPIRLSSWSTSGGRWRRACTSLASCLSGGIFLGVALLHLLPEVREMFDYVLCKKELDIEYPLTEITVAGGFLIILVFEQLVLFFRDRGAESECDIANVPPHGCDRERNFDNCGTQSQRERVAFSSTSGGPVYGTVSAATEESCDSTPLLGSSLPVSGQGAGQQPGASSTKAEVSIAASPTPATGDAAPGETDETRGKSARETFGSLVLLAALSLHSLFEGLALGLQSDSDTTIQIFVAILLHKCVLAFALGIRMVKLKASAKQIGLAALVFAAMSPIGAGIGIAVEANATNEVDRQLVTACLQGIATGTFLFITFLEIISPEIQGKRVRGEYDIQLMRLVLIIVGFTIIAMLSLNHTHDHLECEWHDHDHDHHDH